MTSHFLPSFFGMKNTSEVCYDFEGQINPLIRFLFRNLSSSHSSSWDNGISWPFLRVKLGLRSMVWSQAQHLESCPSRLFKKMSAKSCNSLGSSLLTSSSASSQCTECHMDWCCINPCHQMHSWGHLKRFMV